MVTIIGLFFALFSVGQVGSAPREPVPVDFLTGARFHTELDQATSGTWTNVEFRDLLNKLSVERRVAILLDRRIDPTVRVPLDIVNRSLTEGIQEIARKVQAEVSIPENVVYVGPPAAVRQLRTLIELRTAELLAKSPPIPEKRRTELSRRYPIAWRDLETPDDILRRVAEQFQLKIQGEDLVPYDLWAGCRLPSATAAEALSIILIQFDLTFSWTDGGKGIELVPIPQIVVIERRPRFKSKAAEALKSIQDEFPNLDVRLEGTEIIVKGTTEDHEAIALLLSPNKPKKPVEKGPAPLRQRTFTLKFQRVPVRAVMAKLEESSVVFVYDAAALEAAGISLDQTIDLQLEKATADEFLKAVFSPLKISFEIDHLTVKLAPRK